MPTPPKPNAPKSTDARQASRASESLGASEFDSLADELSSFSDGLFESEDDLKALDRPIMAASRSASQSSLPANRNAAAASSALPKPPNVLPSALPLPAKPALPKAPPMAPKPPPLPAPSFSASPTASRDPFAATQNDPFASLQNGTFASSQGLDESFLPKPNAASLHSSAPIPKDTMQVLALTPPPPPKSSASSLFGAQDAHDDPAETQREIKKPDFANKTQRPGPKEVLNNPPDELWLPVEDEKKSNRATDRVFTIDDVPNMPSRGSRPPSRPPTPPMPFGTPAANAHADTGDSTMMSPHALQPNDFRSSAAAHPPNPFSFQGDDDDNSAMPLDLLEDDDEGDSTMMSPHSDLGGDDDGDSTMLAPNLNNTEASPSLSWGTPNAWQNPSHGFAESTAPQDDWYGLEDALHSPEELSPSSSSLAGLTAPPASGAYSQPPPSRSGAYSQPPQFRNDAYAQPPQFRNDAYAQPPPSRSGAYSQPPQLRNDAYAQPPPSRSGAYSQPPQLRNDAYAQPPPSRSGAYSQPPPFSGNSPAQYPPAHENNSVYPPSQSPFEQPSASYIAASPVASAQPFGSYAQSGAYPQPSYPQAASNPFAHPATSSGAYPQPSLDPTIAPDGSGSHSYPPHQSDPASESYRSHAYPGGPPNSPVQPAQAPPTWPPPASRPQPPALPVVGRGGAHARGGIPIATSRSSASLDSLDAVQPSRSAPPPFDPREADALIAEAEAVARVGAGASYVGPTPKPEKKRRMGLVVLLLLILVTFGTVTAALFAFRFWDRREVVTKAPQHRGSWADPQIVRRQAPPPTPIVSPAPVTDPPQINTASDPSVGSTSSDPRSPTPPRVSVQPPTKKPEDTDPKKPEDTEPKKPEDAQPTRGRKTNDKTDDKTDEDTPKPRIPRGKGAKKQPSRKVPPTRRKTTVAAATPEATTASGLRISIQPACTLYEKGQSLGKTDKSILLQRGPGTYRFLCKEEKKLLFYSFSVTVPASGQAEYTKTLRPGTLYVHSRPWSMVYSKSYGKLGRSGGPITLYEGTYDLLLYKRGSLIPGPGMQLQQRVTIRPSQTTRTPALEFPAQDDDE